MTPMNLETFCLRFQAFLEGKPGTSQVMDVGLKLLGELLNDPGWFREFFWEIAHRPRLLEPAAHVGVPE